LTFDPAAVPAWSLTIHEAINVAIGNSEAVRNLGLVDAASDTDIVRSIITTYDPLAAAALADAEWGIFDPLWTTEMQWNKIDVPPGTSFGGIGNRPPQLDTADFFTGVEQLLPYGTRFRADYVTDYLFNPDHPPTLDPNPQYFSYTQFSVIQPLCQGRGTNVTMVPIRIAAAEAERTDWQFKQEMLALVRSVETAYWTLYAHQQNLRAIDETLPQFSEVVRIRRQQAQGAAGTESDVARAESELLLYQQRRLDTLSLIAEQQLVLRNLLGLPPDDNRYISLVALPVTLRPVESICDAITTAINQRPDVLRQRLAVYVALQEQVVARDSFRPRLDFDAFWRINGLGEDLGESLDVIGQNDFHDWQLGFRMEVPLGRRTGRANIRAAQFNYERERAMLQQAAHQASFEVADAYRRILFLNQQYKIVSSRIESLRQWQEGAKAQFDNPPAGMSTVFALELYLQNLRGVLDATNNANAILADYNSALARFEEVKGTLLDVRLVEVAGDATTDVPNNLPMPEIQFQD
jgi:outer membrane protein TolC